MDAQCTHGSDRKTVSWAQGKRRSALAFVAARASAKRVDHIFARLVSEGVLWREKSAQGDSKTQSRESLYPRDSMCSGGLRLGLLLFLAWAILGLVLVVD